MTPVLDLLVKAHYQAATTNNNVSSAIVAQIGAVGGTFERAVAAALLSLGDVHAPVTQARYILFEATDDVEITAQLKVGYKIPGYGNGFYKDSIDPAFEEFFKYIEKNYPEIWKRVLHVGALIFKKKGKTIYPNAACATGIAAEILNIPRGTEVQLLLMGRLPAWANQWQS